MSKFDSFNRDANDLTYLQEQIGSLIDERQRMLQERKNTNKIDVILKGRLETFSNNLLRLQQSVELALENPSNYGVTEKEAKRRQSKIDDFTESFRIMQYKSITLLSNVKDPQPNDDLEQNLLGDDGEYTNTRGKNNQEVVNVQKQMLRNQDQKFDEIIGIAHGLREDGGAIGRELDEQNKMLDDLNEGMDKTGVKMFKVDNKLKKLISESNQCCLWITIILLAGTLVALIILL